MSLELTVEPEHPVMELARVLSRLVEIWNGGECTDDEFKRLIRRLRPLSRKVLRLTDTQWTDWYEQRKVRDPYFDYTKEMVDAYKRFRDEGHTQSEAFELLKKLYPELNRVDKDSALRTLRARIKKSLKTKKPAKK